MRKPTGRAWRAGLGLGMLASLLLGGCAAQNQVPEFPDYPPTARFLEMQRRVRERADAYHARREAEIRENIAKGRTRFYRDWAPIYARIRSAAPQPRR